MRTKREKWNVDRLYPPSISTARSDSSGRRQWAHWLALVSMIVAGATPAGAQEAGVSAHETGATSRLLVMDVRLDPEGQLTGRVVSMLQSPVGGVTVQLHRLSWEAPCQTTTDANGGFVFCNLSTGQFRLTCDGTTQNVRVWSAPAAPPAATEGLVLVHSPTTIVRGQRPMCDLFCNEPIMIGVLVAAAIAIPLALHDSGDQDNGS